MRRGMCDEYVFVCICEKMSSSVSVTILSERCINFLFQFSFLDDCNMDIVFNEKLLKLVTACFVYRQCVVVMCSVL